MSDEFIQKIRDLKDLTNSEKRLILTARNPWIVTLIGFAVSLGITWGTFMSATNNNAQTLKENCIRLDSNSKSITTLEAVVPRIERQMSEMNQKLDKISERMK